MASKRPAPPASEGPTPARLLQLAPVQHIGEWHDEMLAAVADVPVPTQPDSTAAMLRLSQIRCDVSDEARRVDAMLSPAMRLILNEEHRASRSSIPAPQAPLIEAHNQLKERRSTSRLQSIRIAGELADVDPGTREINHALLGLHKKPADARPMQPVDPEELVALVACFHRERPGLRMQEWLVLGSQPLTALRDRLRGFCLADHANDGPNVKSGFFCIENTFYNDLRDPANFDYSQTIINWAGDPERVGGNPAFAQFRSTDMETTLVRHLSVRLNQPYVYVHQGDCEHVIMFKDVRLVHPTDPQNANEYPVRTFQSKVRRRLCRFCRIRLANKVTYGDRLSGENPAFFCEPCYVMLHYDSNNRLLYSDFKVYDYHQE